MRSPRAEHYSTLFHLSAGTRISVENENDDERREKTIINRTTGHHPSHLDTHGNCEHMESIKAGERWRRSEASTPTIARVLDLLALFFVGN